MRSKFKVAGCQMACVNASGAASGCMVGWPLPPCFAGRALFWSAGETTGGLSDSAALQQASLTAPEFSAPDGNVYRAIEDLRVGQRVVSDNPEIDTPEQTAVDPASWKLVRLYAEEEWADGTLDTIHVETLQPPEWLELWDAQVGAQVPPPLDLIEMGLPADLTTEVVAVETCPELEAGPGRVVLTTVNHLNNDVWELTAINSQGRQEHLRPTGLHKFYSETRGDWVPTKEIHDNEVIRGHDGPLTITGSRQLPGTQRVYNITVEGEHVYYVSELGMLVHNNCSQTNSRFNIFGEGETPSFIDVSPEDAFFRGSRPLSQSFESGVAAEIFVRNSRLSGPSNTNTISEILRLSRPGT